VKHIARGAFDRLPQSQQVSVRAFLACMQMWSKCVGGAALGNPFYARLLFVMYKVAFVKWFMGNHFRQMTHD
jgi:hypothetical protein